MYKKLIENKDYGYYFNIPYLLKYFNIYTIPFLIFYILGITTLDVYCTSIQSDPSTEILIDNSDARLNSQ